MCYSTYAYMLNMNANNTYDAWNAAAAEEVRRVASHLRVTVKIGHGVARALLLGRQLEAALSDVGTSVGPSPATLSSHLSTRSGSGGGKDDHRAMVRAACPARRLRLG